MYVSVRTPFLSMYSGKFTINLNRCVNYRLPQSAQQVHPNRAAIYQIICQFVLVITKCQIIVKKYPLHFLKTTVCPCPIFKRLALYYFVLCPVVFQEPFSTPWPGTTDEKQPFGKFWHFHISLMYYPVFYSFALSSLLNKPTVSEFSDLENIFF